MNEIIQAPKFLVKWWQRDMRNMKGPATVKHTAFYTEEDLINGLRIIKGNYFIFTVGGQYEKDKSYFDELFAEEVRQKEKQAFELLKQKFEGDENN